MDLVIIEDEELAVDVLTKIIKDLVQEANILKSLSSIKEAIKWFELNPSPDLIFCDIHLRDGNSFEIFSRVSIDCPVIFTTAYDKYAIEAFKVNSIDYLLKPVSEEEVAKALKKYKDIRKRRDTVIEDLQRILATSRIESSGPRRRLMVKEGQSIKTVQTEEVAGFLAEEGVVFLFTFLGKRYILNQSLDQLEEELETSQFFRINRRFIINIEAVHDVKPYFKDRLLVKPKLPLELEQTVSKNRVYNFKKWLGY